MIRWECERAGVAPGTRMETVLNILAALAAIIAALAYPRSPRYTLAISVIAATMGAAALMLLTLGPQDYMLRIPTSIATVAHPYVLGSAGMLLLTLGAGGIIGLTARWLLSKRIPRS